MAWSENSCRLVPDWTSSLPGFFRHNCEKMSKSKKLRTVTRDPKTGRFVGASGAGSRKADANRPQTAEEAFKWIEQRYGAALTELAK